MKNKILYFLVVATAALAGLASCGGDKAARINSALEHAEALADEGDYAGAVTVCNDMTESSDTTALSFGDLCRLAVIYATAYDKDVDTEASMASAARCIERARHLSPDSMNVFMSRLAPEKSATLMTVLHTLDALNTDHSTLGDHEEGDEEYLEHSHSDDSDNAHNE